MLGDIAIISVRSRPRADAQKDDSGPHICFLKNDGNTSTVTCLESVDDAWPLGKDGMGSEGICFEDHDTPGRKGFCCPEKRVHLHVHSSNDCNDKSKFFTLVESDQKCNAFPVGPAYPSGCQSKFPDGEQCIVSHGFVNDTGLSVPHGDHYDELLHTNNGNYELHHNHVSDDGTTHCDFHGTVQLRQEDIVLKLLDEQSRSRGIAGKFSLFTLITRHLHEARPKFTTTLIVEGICCPSEEPIIKKILMPLPGVTSVKVIVMAKRVTVVHDNVLTSAARLVSALNSARLGARIYYPASTRPISTRFPPLLVVLAGILWAISLLSYIGSACEEPYCVHLGYLTYVAIAAVVCRLPSILLKALHSLRQWVMDVNVLMSIAVIGACAMKDFPEAAAVVFLFSLGEWLESRATEKTRLALTAITNMKPEEAEKLTGESIPADDVKIDDILIVRVGAKVPVDGVVIRGTAQIDESQISGESIPVQKDIGSIVHAGTISNSGFIEIRATGEAKDSAVAQIARLVEEAASARSPTEQTVQTFAKYYTPLMVLLSVLIALVPNIVLYPLTAEEAHGWIDRAIQLLVTSCPCALVISTPITYISAIITCTRHAILVKGGKFLETVGKVGFAMLDKTGTLTEGRFEVQDFKTFSSDMDNDTILWNIAAVEGVANHPLATCIAHYAKFRLGMDFKEPEVDDFRVIPGEGIEGWVEGSLVCIGNKRMAERLGWPVEVLGNSNGTLLWAGVNNAFVATMVLDDTLRESAKTAMEKLHEKRVRTIMLTGDSQEQADSVARQIGITEVEAELLPKDKIDHVQSRIKLTKKKVAMVGDGINDAAALACAHVGIAMGAAGTALAIETADITLLDSNLERLAFLISTGRKTRRIIIFNVLFSVIMKLIVIVFIFLGHATLWMAILVDVGSMLIVTLNGMRMLEKSGDEIKYKCYGEDTPTSARKLELEHGCCSGDDTGYSHGHGDANHVDHDDNGGLTHLFKSIFRRRRTQNPGSNRRGDMELVGSCNSTADLAENSGTSCCRTREDGTKVCSSAVEPKKSCCRTNEDGTKACREAESKKSCCPINEDGIKVCTSAVEPKKSCCRTNKDGTKVCSIAVKPKKSCSRTNKDGTKVCSSAVEPKKSCCRTTEDGKKVCSIAVKPKKSCSRTNKDGTKVCSSAVEPKKSCCRTTEDGKKVCSITVEPKKSCCRTDEDGTKVCSSAVEPKKTFCRTNEDGIKVCTSSTVEAKQIAVLPK